MAYLGSETREQPASSKSNRALIMLTGTCGPGDGAVWDVTPDHVAFLAGGEAFYQPPGSIPTASVTAWQLNSARPGGQLPPRAWPG